MTTAPGSGSAESGQRSAPPTELARGLSLGRYIVLERLGAGGMGVVYAAYDPELDRKVAINRLRARPEPGAIEQQGDTVVFTNQDEDEHSVFSKDALPTLEFEKSRKGETGRCSGETKVAGLVLEEGKSRKMRRKLGGIYPIYQP